MSKRKAQVSGSYFFVKKRCEVLLEDIRARFGELDAMQLMNLDLWRELAYPDFYSQVASYHYMGRRLTGELIRFIMEDLAVPMYYTNRSAGLMKYISGTPGYGKTVSLNTAFTYLYLRSVKAMEEKQRTGKAQDVLHSNWVTFAATEGISMEESGAQSSVAEDELKAKTPVTHPAGKSARKTKWDPDSYDVSNHRFLLLSGVNFSRNPCRTLFAALVLAYIKDPEGLDMLQGLDSESQDELSQFLYLRCETVHIILDDGNAMDEEHTDTTEKKNDKSSVLEFLLSLQNRNVKLIICASVRSKLRKLVLKELTKYYLGAGGFSEKEVCKYISRVTGKTNEEELRKRAKSMYRRTGWVPRLVAQFILNKRAYRDTRKKHAVDLYHYINRVEEEKRAVEMMELLTAIAGGAIHPLSDAVDTRCYFRGRDGKAQCLTPSLHSQAVGFITERAQHMTTLTGLERVDHFTRIIATDTNLARIGSNSEAATLLVLRLLKANIPGLDLIIEPDQVRLCKGRLTRELIQVPNLKVLFIPEAFNHAGADVYYVTPEVVLVFQITVAANPEKNHPKTEEVARALFEGEKKRVKAVVWNVVDDRSRIEHPSAVADFYRVYVPFGDLHSSLAVIDQRVRELRKLRKLRQGAWCPQCKVEGGPGDQILCDFCGDWYHTSCVSVVDFGAPWYCAECELLVGEESEDEEAKDPNDLQYYEDMNE